MPNLSRSRRKSKGKPSKPYADYPLFAHANGQWAKKIRSKLHYFGPWDNPDGALKTYLDQRDYLQAGRRPPNDPDALTLRELLNRFLSAKQHLLQEGEIVQRTFNDYKEVGDRIAKHMDLSLLVADLRPEDFELLRAKLAKTRGPTSIGNDITRIRMIFKYAYDAELIHQPIRYGQALKKPSRRAIEASRRCQGERMFEKEQIRDMLATERMPLVAMVLLGINCGFGNYDCGSLPKWAVDLDRGWIKFPRPKTGLSRRCPLWPETIEAISMAIEQRPTARDEAHEELVFLTTKGLPWAKDDGDNPVSKETRKLLLELGYHRTGLSFYALRHTFETIGSETGDQVAVDFIMGHAPDTNDMAARYRQRITDGRLEKVTDFVHAWLWGDGK